MNRINILKFLDTVKFSIILAIFSQVNETGAGTPTYHECDYYVNNFNPVLHDTFQGLIRSYTAMKSQLHAVNISLSTEEYVAALEHIISPWHEINLPIMHDCIEFVSNLTGFSNDNIIEVMHGENMLPEFPMSCLANQMLELGHQFYSLETSLSEQKQLLEISNVRIKNAKPDQASEIDNRNLSSDFYDDEVEH